MSHTQLRRVPAPCFSSSPCSLPVSLPPRLPPSLPSSPLNPPPIHPPPSSPLAPLPSAFLLSRPKVTAASSAKEVGNAAYKAGKLERAARFYKAAVTFSEGVKDGAAGDATPEQKARAKVRGGGA